MALYRQARNSTVTTSGNCAADVAISTGIRLRLMEWDIFLGAATASTFSLRRTSAIGTRTSPLALVPEDEGDPTLTGITLVDMAVAFSAEPTEVSDRLALIGLAATIGVGIIWTFPRGLVLATSLSFVVVNDATNAASHNHTAVGDV